MKRKRGGGGEEGELNIERRYNNAISIYYGPLLFALDIPANWTELAYQ